MVFGFVLSWWLVRLSRFQLLYTYVEVPKYVRMVEGGLITSIMYCRGLESYLLPTYFSIWVELDFTRAHIMFIELLQIKFVVFSNHLWIGLFRFFNSTYLLTASALTNKISPCQRRSQRAELAFNVSLCDSKKISVCTWVLRIQNRSCAVLISVDTMILRKF